MCTRNARAMWACRTAAQYEAVADILEDGASRIFQSKMLEILKERARYISERGSTVNNPYVNNTFLRAFFGTSREVEGRTNCGPQIRSRAAAFICEHFEQPAAIFSAWVCRDGGALPSYA